MKDRPKEKLNFKELKKNSIINIMGSLFMIYKAITISDFSILNIFISLFMAIIGIHMFFNNLSITMFLIKRRDFDEVEKS